MERARELYERLKTGGVDYLKEIIEDRISEELFLDFKRSSNNGQEKRLSNTDRNNLSKAISGFGNSEGGVILWGVDCSNCKDGSDVAHALTPIVNPERFRSLIEGVISGCTIPPHINVENSVIKYNRNTGFVATLVPKSDLTPHQAICNKHYYIRAGSNFVPTPHDVLAGMFGKRPQAHVMHQFLEPIPTFENELLTIVIGVVVCNAGPGIASDIFTTCFIHGKPGINCDIEMEFPDLDNWSVWNQFNMIVSMITKKDFKLPPDARLQPMVLSIYLKPPFENELRLTGKVGAGNSRFYEFEIGSDKDTLSEGYYLFSQKSEDDDLSSREKREIMKMILGRD